MVNFTVLQPAMPLERILSEIRSSDAVQHLGIFAYVVVGSTAYLPDAEDAGDTDVVFLATGSQEPAVALRCLAEVLQESAGLRDLCIWYVQAIACLLKVTAGGLCLENRPCGERGRTTRPWTSSTCPTASRRARRSSASRRRPPSRSCRWVAGRARWTASW